MTPAAPSEPSPPPATGDTTWFDVAIAAVLAALVGFVIARVRYRKPSE
jgi:hypothetical protein